MQTTYKVGDKVRILNKDEIYAGDHLINGDIYKVTTQTDSEGDIRIDDGGTIPLLITSRELQYIELISPKPTKKQRLTMLEKEVETLKAEVEALKAAQKSTDISKIAEGITKMVAKEKKLTPNEQRKAIIYEAKAFVKSKFFDGNHGVGKVVWADAGHNKVEFVVNAEKRTIEAILRLAYVGPMETSKGIAKCAPDDVFNADIGKAIALGRALGLDVSKFEKAVQPSEVVVGQVVIHTPCEDIFTIEGIYEGNRYDMRHTDGEYFGKFPMTDSIENFYDILDDTEAQY